MNTINEQSIRSDIFDKQLIGSDIELYGFMGNIGVGKNYVAEQVFLKKLNKKNPKPYLVMAFADHFKITAISFEDLEYEKVFGQKDEYTRKRLQEIGTELGRDKFGPNIWCKTLYNWIRTYYDRGIKRFIITDVRFENEAELIKELGGKIIKVIASDRNLEKLIQETNYDKEKIKELSNHRSEVYIREFLKYDYLIKNRKCDNIKDQVNMIIEKIE